ncbi:histidine utilization repressor [Novosphingobium sp. FSW06-99]|uniref:histidine utilization repressor n=1 Tax=Novosphingobium sp. FSW06-99 TaxID=1739113 RepID=UPI00076BD734|nr:histidine utilization repressor [Novosphingobium sp. FSW06-99]KUR74468.1 histidine utilization repressor [Novosphingobium sp. FSW06-99]
MKPVPLHERIRAEIESAIMAGHLRPGDRIPKETELMAQYDCARMTVNKALSALAGAGMLERRKRAGSFVARPRAQSMVLDVPDLAAAIAARGQRYRWDIASRKITAPDRAQAEALGVSAKVLSVTGVHFAEELPLAFEERMVNLALVPGIADADLSQTPPGSWLIAHVPWTEAENRISAAAAPPAIARALGMARGAPCLVLERRTWRGPDTVTRVRQYFVADRYELVARFGPNL